MSERISVLKGEIQGSESILDGLMVELRNLDYHLPAERVPVTYNGSFEFRNLAAGQYDVRILNLRNDVIQQHFMSIRGTGDPLVLRLRQPRLERPPSGRISAQRLMHPVPSKAAQEFRRSRDFFQAGDTRKTMEHLEKAIQIYPDYMEAHNNLGTCHMALNQYEMAAAEFEKTVALDPKSTKGHLNLSLALSSLKRYPEAEHAARRAVELDSDSVPARYALGQILAVQGKDTPEALENLRRAVIQFPHARLVVARVLVLRGAIAEATSELREYLKSDSPETAGSGILAAKPYLVRESKMITKRCA